MPQHPDPKAKAREALIRRSVEHMRRSGYEESEVQEYLQSVGGKDPVQPSGGGSDWGNGSALNPIVRGALGGIPIVDEIGGAISKLTGGSYTAGRDDIRAAEKDYATRNPGKNIALEIGAGLTSGIGAVRALGKQGVKQIVKRGVGSAMLRGAGAGAVMGAATGAAGTDGSAVARARGAVLPGTIGAVAGGGIPGLTTAVGRVGKAVASGASRAVAATRADELMLDAIQRGKGSLDNARRWGKRVASDATGSPPAAMIDMSRQTQGRGRFVAMSPSRGQEQLQDFLDRRVIDQPGRVSGSAERRLGVNAAGVESADDVIRTRQGAQGRQTYKKAYEHGVIQSPEVRQTLAEMLNDPVFKDAWDRGTRLAALVRDDLPDGVPLSDGTAPTVRLIDYLKKGLDATITSRRGSSSALTRTEANAYRNRLNELLAQVDAEVPDYAQARAGWGAEAQLLDAFEVGASALRTPSREIGQIVEGMTPQQMETARVGLARALRDQMASGKDGVDMTRRVFGSPEMRAQLRPFFPNKQEWNRFRKDMLIEARIAQSRNAVNSGSRTAPMLGEAADAAGANLGDVVTSMANPTGAPLAALRAGAGRLALGANSNISDELSERLRIQPGTERFSEYMSRLDMINRARQAARTRQAGYGAATGVAAGRVTNQP